MSSIDAMGNNAQPTNWASQPLYVTNDNGNYGLQQGLYSSWQDLMNAAQVVNPGQPVDTQSAGGDAGSSTPAGYTSPATYSIPGYGGLWTWNSGASNGGFTQYVGGMADQGGSLTGDIEQTDQGGVSAFVRNDTEDGFNRFVSVAMPIVTTAIIGGIAGYAAGGAMAAGDGAAAADTGSTAGTASTTGDTVSGASDLSLANDAGYGSSAVDESGAASAGSAVDTGSGINWSNIASRAASTGVNQAIAAGNSPSGGALPAGNGTATGQSGALGALSGASATALQGGVGGSASGLKTIQGNAPDLTSAVSLIPIFGQQGNSFSLASPANNATLTGTNPSLLTKQTANSK